MVSTKYVISVILLLLGAFYALMPHSVHIASGIGFGLGHTAHIVFGLILAAIGIALIVKK